LLARQLVDHSQADLCAAQPVAEFRGQEPLDLLPAQGADALEQRADLQLGAAFGEQHASHRDPVPSVALTHRHLVGALVGAGRRHRQRIAHCPKAQQPDAELALEAAAAAFGLQVPLDRIADLRGDVLEVGHPGFVARHAVAIVLDRQVVLTLLAPACDRDGLGAGVDAVFDELRKAFKGLLCESAMMRIAFQSSPIFSLPPSLVLALGEVMLIDAPRGAWLPSGDETEGYGLATSGR
jgi:hypothetical protein